MLDLIPAAKRENPEFGAFEAFIAQMPYLDEHSKYAGAVALSKSLCRTNGFRYDTMKRKLVEGGYAVWGENYYSGIHHNGKEWKKYNHNETYCQPVYLTQKTYDLSSQIWKRYKGERFVRHVKNTQWEGVKEIKGHHIKRVEAVKVDVEALDALLDTEYGKQAKLILDQVEDGVLHQNYYQCRTGRYTAIGPSLQNVKKEVRKAALKGKWSYDIDSTHPTLLNQLYPLDVLQQYIDNKEFVRNKVAEECGIEYDQAKSVILAIQYSASINVNPNNSLTKLLGEDMDRVSNNQWIKEYKGGLEGAAGYLTRHYRGTIHRPREMSWILQGHEVRILEAIMLKYPIEAIQHDGWASEERLDVEEMQEHIYQSTGFRVTIKEEKL